MHIEKTFLVCSGKKCGNVLGCYIEGHAHKFCETTKPGEEERSFGCNKEQFFSCTFEKDMIECGDATGKIVKLLNSHCRHCPSDVPLDLSEEELGPIAFLSSPLDISNEINDLCTLLEEACGK